MNSFLQFGRLLGRCVTAAAAVQPALRLLSVSAHSCTKIFPRSLVPSLVAARQQSLPLLKPSLPETTAPRRTFEYFSFTQSLPRYINRIITDGPPKRKKRKLGPTDGRPFLKGVVLKTLIKKPKKPNSANRKCVRVRLSTGREATAYVPGIGHNLQEHHIVLVRGGKMQDLPGVKLKCVRGKYDLAHVKKATWTWFSCSNWKMHFHLCIFCDFFFIFGEKC